MVETSEFDPGQEISWRREMGNPLPAFLPGDPMEGACGLQSTGWQRVDKSERFSLSLSLSRKDTKYIDSV